MPPSSDQTRARRPKRLASGNGGAPVAAPDGRPRLHGLAAAAATAALVVLAALLATAAQAQLEDPGQTDLAPGQTDPALDNAHTALDNAYTPAAKQTESWERIAGASGPPRTKVPELSATPFDADFFTVAFTDYKHGFFAGAQCVRDEPDRQVEGAATVGCERVPVIYQYRDDGTGKATIEAYRGAGTGYVAQLAWIGKARALAVGGDGVYPRREPARESGESDSHYAAREPAGGARAWLYDPAQYADESWHELEGLPDGMRGLSALACSPDGGDLCFAGGYRQLWRWQDGAFRKGFSHESPEADLQGAKYLRFRVRAIAFANNAQKTPMALTAGCCDSIPAHNFPRVLASDATDKWYVASTDSASDVGSPNPESFYSLNRGLATVVSPDGPAPQDSSEPASYVGGVGVPPRPSSGAPQPSVRPPDSNPSGRTQSTLRLLSVDGSWAVGELRSTQTALGAQGVVYVPQNPATGLTPSGSWPAASRLTGSWSEAGATHFYFHERLLGCPYHKGFGVNYLIFKEPDAIQECDLHVDDEASRIVEEDLPQLPAALTPPPSQLYKLDSYTLNAFQLLASGVGFAVGDHGALVRYGTGATLLSDEPGAPDLGKPEPGALSNGAPYDPFRPPLAAGQAGAVPPLGGLGVEQLPEPGFTAAGSPDPHHASIPPVSIVMSRDGSEGWAVGVGGTPNNISGKTYSSGAMTLYHYDGSSWRNCDPRGSGDQFPPDPACAGLGPLAAGGVSLRAAAQVPTSDDKLEVVALATSGAIVRYRDGRWEPMDGQEGRPDWMGVIGSKDLRDIAFSAPNDGWIVSGPLRFTGGPSSPQEASIYHFDGTSWTDCKSDRQGCADPGGKLPYGSLEPWVVNSGINLTNANPLGVRLATAGTRVYMFATRAVVRDTSSTGSVERSFPMVIYRDSSLPCNKAGDPGCWRADGGGYDPGCQSQDTSGKCVGSQDSADQGRAYYGSVAKGSDGYEGWVTGELGGPPLLRLKPGGTVEKWSEPSGSAGGDYGLAPADPGASAYPRQLVATAGKDGQVRAFTVRPISGGQYEYGLNVVLGFSPERPHFELLPTPFHAWGVWDFRVRFANANGSVKALAGDGQGGFWAIVIPGGKYGEAQTGVPFFYHYTDRPPRPVFADVPHPALKGVTALAGGGDGSLWVATKAEDALYRYDRVSGGWERARIPGWDRGAVKSGVSALAVGSDGSGVAVGRGGRIADLAPGSVALDPAAGRACAVIPTPPCGTTSDLSAAAVAPDGSALLAGTRLLWRPAGEGFRRIERPGSAGDQIVSIAFPTPGRAWLLTSQEFIFGGELSGSGDWSWRPENLNDAGERASYGGLRLRAFAVGPDGHGLAVGDGGLVLERSGEDPRAWRRLAIGFTDTLSSVALPVGGGAGALIGGEESVILTRAGGGFRVARPADPYDLLNGRIAEGAAQNGLMDPVVGLALLPGPKAGQVEAWAALDSRRVCPIPGCAARDVGANSSILHYGSDPSEPLLDAGAGRAEPLPDSPAPRPGEISFAAFGKSDCHLPSDWACPPMLGTNFPQELVARRVTDDVLARTGRPGGPKLAIFTGDAGDAAGPGGHGDDSSGSSTPLDASTVHNRWRELIAERLQQGGLPLFGAVGGQDLSQAQTCRGVLIECRNSSEVNTDFSPTLAHGTGLTIPWRQAMAGMAPPWGNGGGTPWDKGKPATNGSLSFEGVKDPATSLPEPDQDVAVTGPVSLSHVVGGGGVLQPETYHAPLGGARTHYALDICRGQCTPQTKLARIVVVDTSTRSLSGSDANQNPKEPNGGQAAWLEQVLCFDESPQDTNSSGGDCTREAGEPAIVVSSTPTYTYAPISPTETQTDAATFEATLLRYRASVVVSGHLGWQGLYWALAAGLHYPCPGQAYQQAPPDQAKPSLCDQGPGGAPGAELPSADRLADALGSAAAPAAPLTGQLQGVDGSLRGPLPFVVSSSAGGKFNDGAERAGQATPSNGFWRGYAIVRVDASGDPRATIVEQRPVLDWVTLTAKEHTLLPGQRLKLKGSGREAVAPNEQLHYDPIDSPAITHRFDLLEADPGRPWLPKVDPESLYSNHYVPLDPSVATIDSQSGLVKAINRGHPRTFAIALLSVGDKAASWPLVFEPRKSYRPRVPKIAPALPVRPVVLSQPPKPPPPPAPNPPGGTTANVSAPSPPAPPPPAQSLEPPPITAPTPPSPPLPPGSAQSIPLNVAIEAPAVTVVPPPGVFPPPAPPVQPAPPSGARREARQRQAATQKSGAKGSGVKSEAASHGGDIADAPFTPGASALTRRDRVRPEASFTAVSRREQPSTWARGALYGGGLTLMALALALGWTTVRPTPRRRTPELPAPAWTWSRRR